MLATIIGCILRRHSISVSKMCKKTPRLEGALRLDAVNERSEFNAPPTTAVVRAKPIIESACYAMGTAWAAFLCLLFHLNY
jgi:hypothetical protein